MTNIWSLKNKRRKLSKMITKARKNRAKPEWVRAMMESRDNLNDDIRKLRLKKKPKMKIGGKK